MAEGGVKGGRMSVEVDGKRVSLSADGIKEAGKKGDVAEKLKEAVTAGLDRRDRT